MRRPSSTLSILFLMAARSSEKLGFDLVWLGALFCLNMQTSYIAPPFGLAAFYLKGVTRPGTTSSNILGSARPYLIIQTVALALVMAFPQIAV